MDIKEIEDFKRRVKKVASGIFFHLPKGQKMSSFDTKRPNVNHGQFIDGSMKYIFASLGIPYEVALLVFQNNFSASRASLKMFEMILKYLRKYVIIDNFYQVVYSQFFEIECLKGNIDAPNYIELKNDNSDSFSAEPTYILAQDLVNKTNTAVEYELVRVFEAGEVDNDKVIFVKTADADNAQVLAKMKNNGFHLTNVQQLS